MAIENALIAKLGAGLITVGGATSGGIYYKEQIKEQFNSIFSSKTTSSDSDSISKNLPITSTESEGIPSPKTVNQEEVDDFLILVKSVNTTPLVEDLYTTPSGGTEKTPNFKCKFKEQEDTTCDIYKFPEISNNKLNDLEKIKASNINPTKTDITKDTYFKLKIKKNSISESKFDGNETISAVKTTGDASLATFSVLYKLEENTVKGKTNLFIGKAKNAATKDIVTDTSQCKLQEKEETKTSCSIYKFSNQPSSNETYKDLSFENSSITSATNQTDIAKGFYFLIELKNSKYDISELTSNSVIVYEKTSNPSETTVVEFESIVSLASNEDFSTNKTSFFLS